MLEDIAILTGAKPIFKDLGIELESVKLSDLGKAAKVSIDNDNTTIVMQGKPGDHVKARIEQIRREIEVTTSDYDREKLQERLAKLTGGVAVVRAGAATETEMKERKDLLEDALHATRAAAEEGIVPGGGLVFLRAIPAVREAQQKAEGDEKLGFDIIAKALTYPTRQIVDNSGRDGGMVVSELLEKKGSIGYNAATEEYIDMFEAGIIDPAKVSRTALQNAASVAGIMLTTQVLITTLKDDEEPQFEAVC